MIIKENYNTCKQKYGKELTDRFLTNGLSDNYLMAACRFYIENHVPVTTLVPMFKEWNSYVSKYYPNINPTNISYENFNKYIAQAKLKHCLPNTIIVTDNASLGRLDNVKDARNIPVESTWCIKARSRFDSIMRAGDELYAIYLPNEPAPFTYNIALIQRGNITFWNSDNKRQFDYGNDPEKNLHEIFLTKLPSEIYNYLLDRAEKQRNKTINCNKNMNRNRKNVIRLTESKLRNMIKESVKQVLKENDDFIGHGYKTTSNMGGNEIQISDSGDAARLKLLSGKITDWLEIEFDEEGVAYVTTPEGNVERLDEYMSF